ncbi:MAG: glycosyltransferase family A protein [Methylovulum sp.]|nr:glycosyltransferase family A protein [Methylovulum sp.]
MNADPLISIIIPTRNRGALLHVCLNAIQAQTYPHYEVLLIDDGSSLENRNIAKQLLQNYDHRVQWHEIHAPDTQGSGPSAIRNKGIALAQGNYITFCDDDDYWCRPEHLQTAVECMSRQDAHVYFCGIQVEDPDGNVIIEKMMPNVERSLKTGQKLADYDVYQISRQQILSYPDYAHMNITIVSKALLEKIGGFWEHIRYCEDMDMFIRICDAADTILFRPSICAVHNAPAKRRDVSVSNSLSLQNKRLLEVSAYQHLLMACSSPCALYYTRISLSYLYKVISEELAADGKKLASLQYAQCGLAVYPTLKWAAYLAWRHLAFFLKL